MSCVPPGGPADNGVGKRVLRQGRKVELFLLAAVHLSAAHVAKGVVAEMLGQRLQPIGRDDIRFVVTLAVTDITSGSP